MTSPVSGAAARLRGAARQAGRPVWLKVRRRIDGLIVERLAPLAEREQLHAEQLHLRLDETQQHLRSLSDDLAAGMQDCDRRLREVAAGLEWLDHEHRRIGPQLAAVEARLAELERGVARAEQAEPGAEEPADPSLAAVLAEIRAEHARVRARLGTVNRYEERLARLEGSA
ncbi:hypothetical protein [Actinokineospora bangkokensis]|uniref:Uncharacterized protein n=1 Tax=Actinokineospora bangkokensis TaxID=1193682 RepID=A0A1Q9LH82_9PSEU|nr:hypothetical protein [Actinokineospora bangkokensis]OLR91407.1 hypothetical protein BJP25_00765 [Actinokineospora bangkokensis]